MLSEASPAPAPTTSKYDESPRAETLPTFLDHIHELRRRLFWVVAVVLVVSAVAYSFLNDVINLLTAPLGDKQLYYLTPAGGLTFTFKLCAFVGFVVGVPVLMYHIYRFLEPLMGTKRKSALFYVGLSTLFAAAGVAFAYFISLPAALHFLTNFNLGNIQAMLTVDSYLSFVVTYLLGAALLFQIPLLLLIVNTMTPLQPKKLMKLQKFVIVGAFILAAMISPTPDIMNQTFLAIPIIGMYQLGIVLVWLQQRSAARNARREERRQHVIAVDADPALAPQPTKDPIPTDVLADLLDEPAPQPATVAPPRIVQAAPAPRPVAERPAVAVAPMRPAPTLSVAKPGGSFRGRPIQRQSQGQPRVVTQRPVRPMPMADIARPQVPARPATTVRIQPVTAQQRPAAVSLNVPARTIDGFVRPASATSS